MTLIFQKLIPDSELECLASWREGRLNFLVVKMEHSHISSSKDEDRCYTELEAKICEDFTITDLKVPS